MPELILTIALVLLLLAARTQWRKAKEHEALNAQLDAQWAEILRRAARLDAVAAAMQRGHTDDHQCEVCQHVVPVRELVVLHDDAALCCLACAEIVKPTKNAPATPAGRPDHERKREDV